MSNRHLIGRRQFVMLSSTCAVAAATVGPKLFARELASQPKRLAVQPHHRLPGELRRLHRSGR